MALPPWEGNFGLMKRHEEHQGKQELPGSKDPEMTGQCFVLLNSPARLIQGKGGCFQQWGKALGTYC